MSMPPTPSPDVLCLSHLRWHFVFQRPQHLMTRCARDRRVFFFEEPIADSQNGSRLSVEKSGQVTVLTPHVSVKSESRAIERAVKRLLSDFMRDQRVWNYIAWYYTPMA